MRVQLEELRWAGVGMLALAASRPLWPDGAASFSCPFRAVTGVPCPLCGLTTSVCATVALRFGDAVAANPFGIVAVLVALALVVVRARGTVSFPPWVLGAGLAASQVAHLARA